jgi:uncharacterized membrane protein
MRNWTKILAFSLAVIAIVLLAYALLAEEPDPTTDEPRGMWDNARSYSTTNIAIIVAASFLIAVSAAFILLREEYEPLPPSLEKPPPPPPKEEVVKERSTSVPTPAKESSAVVEEHASEELAAEENYLVLRLLSGDERAMFKAIMDSGGEALQKDLIKRTKMSNAKVSRVLDRLEQKGVVSKERYGSTNKIRISLKK